MIHGFLLILLFLSFSYLIFTIFAVRRFLQSSSLEQANFFPPVTVFKPVRGVHPESKAIFKTFLEQNYPHYQILFGVQDPNDPVIPILEELQKETRENVEFTVVVDSKRVGINPKISNLSNMEKHAKYDIFVISDSDVIVSPDYLSKTVSPFSDTSVGVVTSIYKAKLTFCQTVQEKLVMALEALTISVDYMPSVLVAKAVGKTGFAFGQNMAVRREALSTIGGFKALADCNADDYQLGARVKKAGFKVFLSPHPVETVLFPEQFKNFLARRLRWSRAISACEPWGYLGSFITYFVPLSLFNLVGWSGARGAWVLFFSAILAKIFVAVLNNHLLIRDQTIRFYWWLLPFVELLGFFIWCGGLLPHPVVWYGEKYILKRDGTMVKM